MVLAIDIGGSQFGMAVCEADGRVRRRITVQSLRFEHADGIIAGILEAGRKLAGRWDLTACGIGFGGPVDFPGQRIVNSTHVPGWEDCPITQLVCEALGIPVIVDNDANVGALGEFTFGAGRGCRHLVYTTISTGIGGGVIIEGRIFRGGDGFAGELGHVPILPDGPICECGNRGCLEVLCSGTAIARRGEAAVQRHPRLGRGIRDAAGDGPVTARAVMDAACGGNRLACELVDEICVHLGMGIAASINLLGPDKVVVGGGVSRAGRTLFAPLRKQVRRFLMPVHRPHFQVVPAKLGTRSVLLGAVALARTLRVT